MFVYFQAFYYPPDAGLPVGGAGSSRYLRLEVHYHNPLLISGTEKTSVCGELYFKLFLMNSSLMISSFRPP